MQAFRIGTYIIAADTPDDAVSFYRNEIEAQVPSTATKVDRQTIVRRKDGSSGTVKEIIDDVMDERSAWVKMGIPCDLLYPFIVSEER